MDLIASLQNETCLVKKRSVLTTISADATAFAGQIEYDADRFAAALLSSGIPRSSERDEEREYDKADFVGVAETAAAALDCAGLVLRSSPKLSDNVNVSTLIRTLCYAHCDVSHPWSSDTAVSKSTQLLPLLKSDAVKVIKHILPNLTKETWKKNPCYRHIFKRALVEINLPHLSDHLDSVLPPTLIFLDDYMTHNQLLGLSCLRHVLANASPTELRWRGRNEVVHDALKHLLYVREPEVVDEVYACFKTFLFTEAGRTVRCEDPLKADEVYRELLRGAECEQRIALRTAYSKHLASYIDALGIEVTKYMQKTLRTVLDHAEVYDGPEQAGRRNGLRALVALIAVAWPRTSRHFDEIVRTLFKVAYDLEDRRAKILNEEIAACLKVLKDACPEEFAKFLEELRGLEKKDVPGIELLLSCCTA